MVGPIPVGVNRFQFQADPPQADSIPASDILGVTVILLTCAYDDKEFIRVGYYQNNEYPEGSEERKLWEDKLEKKEKIASVDVSKVVRNILADKPKVTRFNIKWYIILYQWLRIGIIRTLKMLNILLLNLLMVKSID
jgi:histone chaperone ASF1